MLDNEFDQWLRGRLKDHPSAVPEDMWERIHGKEDGRRRFILWRWYVIAPLLLVAAAAIIGSRLSRTSSPRLAPSSALSAAHMPKPLTGEATAIPQPLSQPSVSTPRWQPLFPQSFSLSQPRSSSLRKAAVPRTSSLSYTPRSTGNKKATAFHPLPSLALISSRPYPSPYAQRPKGKDLPCPDPEHLSKNSGWFLDVYGSPDKALFSQRSAFSYSAGIRFGKTFKNGLSATIGLEYSRLSLHGGNDSSAVLQNLAFKNIDLPVLIGYQIGASDLNATIHAGLVWNLHSQPAGVSSYYFDYRSTTGMSLYLGLDVLKSINSRMSLFAEPWFRHPLSYKPTNLIQTSDLGGLSIGIRYNFEKPVGLK